MYLNVEVIFNMRDCKTKTCLDLQIIISLSYLISYTYGNNVKNIYQARFYKIRNTFTSKITLNTDFCLPYIKTTFVC